MIHDDFVSQTEEFTHPGIAAAVPRYFHASSFGQEWIRRTELIGSWTALPSGSRVHLFDTGHFWAFEARHETVDVIRAFLDSVTG